MRRKNILIVMGSVAVLIVVGGFGLWNWVLGDTQEASGPVQAAPVQVDATQTPAAVEESSLAAETQTSPTEVTSAATGLKIFTIVQDESEARFTIYEELLGQPKDVVGTTNQIAGEMAVDLNDLSTIQVGEIRVNARTLATDENRRNQAIRNRILLTDDYEFISFAPAMVLDLSGSASPGETFQFEIAGELTIKDITNPVVFNVTAEMVSEDQITGSAEAVIKREDFDLVIPSVPSVANVGGEITLQIDFVAVAAVSASE